MLIVKDNLYFSCYILMAIFALTFLNKLAMLLLPVLYFVTYFISTGRGQYRKGVSIFFFLVAFVMPIWIYSGEYWFNWFSSLILLGSFLASVSQAPVVAKEGMVKVLKFCILIMVIHAVIGMTQYALYRHDDAFIGVYGRSGLQGHGLAIVYVFLSSFLFFERSIFGEKSSILIASVFALSFLLCFYGTGVVHVAVAVLVVLLFKMKPSYMFYIVSVGGVLSWFFSYVNPSAFEYNINVIYIFIDSLSVYFDGHILDEMPRRLVFILEYFRETLNNAVFFLFGSGPGTYNSRTSFLLNGDYSSLSFLPVSIHPLAADLVFPLWDSEILSKNHSDGSMNQPFSSFFAILAEYGVILGGMYLFIVYRTYSSVKGKMPFELWMFLGVFFIMLTLFENIIDYPEVLFPFVIIIQYYRSKPFHQINREFLINGGVKVV